MCGFVGILSVQNNITQEILGPMVETIHHRGPDDYGIWCEENVGFAHARLSIHDLSAAGHQPMASHSGRWVIAFNGEIYNFNSLREELLKEKNHTFIGDSDTEVLVNAIEHWGIEKTLKKSTGMFAFSCWDKQEKVLYLARDRFGEKPLYYGKIGHDLVFASELKAISSRYKQDLEIDRDVLATYMRYGYIHTPYSIYENVYKLEPGKIVKITNDLNSEEITYWSSIDVALKGYENPLDISFTEAVDTLERQLKQTLSDQMLADVPLGAFLSGGVDSSAVVALMQSISTKPIKTFSIGFHEKKYDEAPYAKSVANHLKTDHTELYVTARQALDVIPKLADIYDEPFADSSQVPTFLVSQLTKQHVTVSLSGDAGDELFGGYNRYFFAEKIKKLILDRKFLSAIVKSLPDRIIKLVNYIPQKKIVLLSDKIQKMKKVLLASNNSFPIFYRNICSQYQAPNDMLDRGKERRILSEKNYSTYLSKLDPMSWMMLIDACTYMMDDILVKVDRAAMAVSLETRVPFLDHRIYELAWKMPKKYKVRGRSGKEVLKHVLYKHVPRDLIDRPKMGFGIPYDQWLRGELSGWAGELLNSQKLKQQGYLDPDLISRLWKEHRKGKRNWQAPLWSALMFQSWLERL